MNRAIDLRVFRNIRFKLIAFLALSSVIAVIAVPVATAHASSAPRDQSIVTTSDVSTALDRTDARNGNLVADAQPSKTDADSAAQSANADVPVDPTQGVSLKTHDGQFVMIAIPGANSGHRGIKNHRGEVIYPGTNGSANAVVPTADGVQFLTTISGPKAPTAYRYKTVLPSGYRYSVTSSGSRAVIIGSDSTVIALTGTAIASDANGKTVSSRYEVSDAGQTLVQIVSHRVTGVTYPVVADPWFSFGWGTLNLLLNRSETNHLMYGWTLLAAAGGWLPPPFGQIATGVYGSLAGYANWVYNRGGCVRVILSVNGSAQPGSYFGGYCR